MPVDEKTRNALDLKDLRPMLPTSIPVVELQVEDYIDW